MEEEIQKKKSLRGTLDSARQAVGRTMDKTTGVKFRREFEEFTDAVTTTVLGIHRGQSELLDQISTLESSKPTVTSQAITPKLAIWAFALSLLAVGLSSAALVMAVL